MSIDAMIRAIVREELAAIGGPSLLAAADVDPIRAFVATLVPGEEVGATELRARYFVWLERELPGSTRPSANRFGRLLMASGQVTRRAAMSGSLYSVRARAPAP